MENNNVNYNFLEELEEYFKNTPREKVLEDWDKSRKYDEIGPTCAEFLSDTLGVFKLTKENWFEIAKIIDSDYKYAEETFTVEHFKEKGKHVIVSNRCDYCSTITIYHNISNKIFKITSFGEYYVDPDRELTKFGYGLIVDYLKKMDLESVFNKELLKY